jgi:hypothetical protein
MARRDIDAGNGAQMPDGKGKLGRRPQLVEDMRPDSVPRQNAGAAQAISEDIRRQS